MKIAIRLSCVAAAGFALAAGFADAQDGVVIDRPPPGEGSDPWLGGGDVYVDPTYFDGDPTGGACFYETMGGDGIAIASELGFTVSEVYEGSCVADPGEANGLF